MSYDDAYEKNNSIPSNNENDATTPGLSSSLPSKSICVIFEEEKRAFRCIQELKTIRDDKNYRPNDQALEDLRNILDKYLELPSLLDRYIARLVDELSQAARPILEEMSIDIKCEQLELPQQDQQDDENYGSIYRERFWSSPLPRILSAIYALCKVRGRKKVQKFLPHQVHDVEPVLNALRTLDILQQQQSASSSDESFRRSNNDNVVHGRPELWESIYSLWNWMGIIGKVPFDCEVVVETSQVSKLLELAVSHLSETGPTREMAASCLACWLTRPDLENSSFQKSFQEWSMNVLNADAEGNATEGEVTTGPFTHQNDIFTVMGILQTLVTMLKVSTAPRDVILASMGLYWPLLLQLSSTNNKPSNILLRKYCVKWWTRLGALYLPPRIVSWRYQRGRRSLKKNLQQQRSHHGEQCVREQRTTASADDQPECVASREDNDYFFHVPDQVEMAMHHVLNSLKDVSTVVRWSAAKGVGRITSRLPAICAEDVLDAILCLFDDIERDNDWHGACLALAELARRGLLLPHRLKDVVRKIVVAIHYDVPRRQTSVGAHVRDAACYTYWALARAYSPETLRPFVHQLGESVVVAFLFDREVNCRRAASAAFQEMVGRQGAQNFQNGIAILTLADYFTLGNRKESYTSIALHVAQFQEYRKAIIDHLFAVKLSHWDTSVRQLAAESLHGLTALDPQYMSETVLPFLLESCIDDEDPLLRHGSTLGLAEIVLAFGSIISNERYLSPNLHQSIAEIIPIIEKKRLYRGKGGEQMRAAVCRLIECISKANITLTVPQQVRLLDSVDACLSHPNETIQDHAGNALYSLMRTYFPVTSKGPSERLHNRVVDKYSRMVCTSVNPAATRGFSLGLGCLPAKLLAPSSSVLDISLSCLCRASSPESKVGNEKDAETRRNAVVALARICETVMMKTSGGEKNCVVEISQQQISDVFNALLRAMGDYNTDQRGDVGSKCRIASMKGLVTLASMSSLHTKPGSEYFSRSRCLQIVGLLLKQLSEKLDFVRSEAAKCLLACLDDSSPMKPYIAERHELLKALTPENLKDGKIYESANWADASTTFPMVMKAADIDEYFEYIISGMILSVGCLTQSVTQKASLVLIDWARNTNDKKLGRLGAAFLSLFDMHSHDGRVILPLLKTVDLLMNRMCFDRLVKDQSFASSLLAKLRQEAKGCKDVHRLAAILDVATGLVISIQESRDAVAFVCELLMHEYPRVRSLAAEKLYVRLLETNPDLDEDHPAVTLLLHHTWEFEGGRPQQNREMAVQISKAFEIDRLLQPG